MNFSDCFPIWKDLTPIQQKELEAAAMFRTVPKSTVLHNGSLDCLGLILIETGQVRTYIVSDEGREITLYRLVDMDMCLLSAPCVMNSIQFDLVMETEKETSMWVIPPDFYKALMAKSAPVSNYTNQLMAERFSEVMWLLEQIMWSGLDKRLATFLMEESNLEGSSILKLTHEKIANHIGSAREVVTRMLKYFQSEGIVKLHRGTVELVDTKKLESLE